MLYTNADIIAASAGGDYDTLQAREISHQAALFRVADRNVGILPGLPQRRALYDENTAWGNHNTAAVRHS